MQVIAFGLAEVDTRARYDDLFEACPHAYIQQSTHWAEALQGLGPDQPIFLLASEGGREFGGLPLYLYRGAAGSILTSVPYAGPLGGVFSRLDSDRERVYAALLGEAQEIARAHGCLALTIISNPIDDDVDLYHRHLAPSVSLQNFTQIVDLDAVVSNGRLVLRNNKKGNPAATIKKAEAAGFSARLCSTSAEFEAWYTIHVQRAAEIPTAPLDRRLAEHIWRDLGARGCSFLQLVMAGDEIAAGCLMVLHKRVCDVFAVSMNSAHASNAPNYLAVKAAMLEMATRGVKMMNWQSSPRRGDGVYKFKRQWGSEEKPYYFLTKTFCEDERILRLGAAGLRQAYPGHFVVPFGCFEAGTVAGTYLKGA